MNITRRSFGLRLAGVPAAAMALMQTGCGAAGALQYLNLAVGALEVLIPLLGPTSGIAQGTLSDVENYAGSVSDAITKASDILSSPESDASKALDIAQAFAGIAKPLVPAQYGAIVSAVAQVAKYIAQFLSSSGGNPSFIAAHSATTSMHLLTKDQMVLAASIRERSVAVRKKLPPAPQPGAMNRRGGGMGDLAETKFVLPQNPLPGPSRLVKSRTPY